ncbi:hypothetical protein LJPFL01_1422 [Lelliottia jeotgali]|nr:hypothetical protein LJPFL01_1422 [Lelliottia jeotgali]
MLPSVNLVIMRRVSGMDVQCQLMNLYAINMIKYFYLNKKNGQSLDLPVLMMQ